MLTGYLAVSSVAATSAFSSSDLVKQLPLSTRIRNFVIESVWSLPPPSTSSTRQTRQCHEPSPPPKLLARYSGDVILRFRTQAAQESEALAEAVRILLLYVFEFNRAYVYIRLSKELVPSLLGLLPRSLQTAHTPLMRDLAEAVYESYPSPTGGDHSSPPIQKYGPFGPNMQSPSGETNLFFRQYQPLSVIIPWMKLLRSLFPTHVRLISLGISYEGREIQGLRVGVHPTNDEKPSEPRKTIIVTGGSHAREWIATSTVNYVAYSFITAYGRDRGITKILEKFDFVFVPTLNPDGYVYTWESDRLWRKNRQQTPLRFCQGIDLDRSFGFQWTRDDGNPCSEGYPGEAPFEAKETRRLVEWAKNETNNNNVDIVGVLDLHSYSQQILYPYSYSCTSAPPTLENLEELAMGLAKAIRITSGEVYTVTAACEGTLPVTCENGNAVSTHGYGSTKKAWPQVDLGGGSAIDYFYHELKVPFTYQLKLRDTGSYGFLLPSDNIVPTGKEALKVVEYFGGFLAGNRGIEDVLDGIHDGARLTHPKEQEGYEAGERVVFNDQGTSDIANAELKRRWRRR